MRIACRINGRATLTAAARSAPAACRSAATTASTATSTAGSLCIFLGFPTIDVIAVSAVLHGLVIGTDISELSGFPIHHFGGFHHATVPGDGQAMVVHVHVDIVMCL